MIGMYLAAAALVIFVIRIIDVAIDKIKEKKVSDRNGDDREISSSESTIDLLSIILKRLNCQPEIEKDGEDLFVTFSFQGGHFRIMMQPTNPYIGLSFLYFFETTLDCLHQVRSICNDLNVKYKISKCVYSVDKEKHQVQVHVLSGFILTKEIPGVETYFEGLLTDCFDLKHSFVQLFNEQQNEEKEDDPELENAELRRTHFLLREQEFAHQPKQWQWRMHETKKLLLGEFLNTFLDSEEIVLKELKVTTNELSILSDSSMINNFDLLSPMVNSMGDETALFFDHATLIVTYLLPFKARFADSQRMIIDIKSEGKAENSYYFRITCTIPALSVGKDVSLNSDRNQSKSYSLLVAFDTSSDARKKMEFEYLWEDAKEKILNGRKEDLTEEQRLICDCTLQNDAYYLYWGKNRFLAERYYEALLHLENAYYSLQSRFHALSNSEKEMFYETCYLIGFCYCEFQQYQRAYFFLDITFTQNRITHTQEYVNCLANSKDFRAIHIIDSLLNNLQQPGNSEEELPPHIVSFIHFLRRRKAYVLIDQEKLDEAAEIFSSMLNEPENSDYALDELAYIQQLKEQKLNT